MKNMLEFITIEPKYTLSKIIKQSQMIYTGGYYEMSEARFVALFQNILAPGFGGNLASVLNFSLIHKSGRD